MNLNAFKHVFLSTWWERKNSRSVWVHWTITGLAAAIAALMLAATGFRNIAPAASLGFFVFGVGNLLILWWSFSLNAIRLDTPQHAQLTPAGKKTIVASYIVAWLAASLGTAGLFSMMHGHFLPSFFAVGTALLWITLAWGTGNLIATIALILACMSISNLRQIDQAIGLSRGEPVAEVGAMLALLVLLLVTIRLAFGGRGDKSYALHEKIRRRQDMLKIGTASADYAVPRNAYLFAVDGRLYQAGLDRLLASHAPRNGMAIDKLLRYGFGPAFGYRGVLYALLIVVLIEVIGPLLPGPLSEIGQAFGHKDSHFFGFMTAMLMAVTGSSTLMALYRTRHEQALLRLLPQVPQGSALNLAIARIMLRSFAGGLFLACASALAASQLAFGVDLIDAAKSVACAAVVSLAVAVLLLPDYSSMRRPTLTGLIALALSLPLFGVMTLVSRGEWPASGKMIFVILVAACCLYLIYRCRDRLARAPVALPVGRISSL